MNRLLLVLGALAATASAQIDLSPEKLAGYLQRFPDADANKDGTLSIEEATAYYATMRRARSAAPAAQASAGPAPTFADVSYGPHQRNVLDFWRAKSEAPAPLVVFIHGGGFVGGDKSKVRGDKLLQGCLDSGVSFAAINYRYRTTAPIQDVLRDCARAIQFLRSKSAEWHIDKTRVASFGGSAGAGTSLWLAFHDDLADPDNADPVLRESSRLACAGALSSQCSYDVLRWVEIFGEDVVRRFADPDWPAFYGFRSEAEGRGAEGARVRAGCDMLGMISKDDPPIFLSTSVGAGEVKDRGHYLHHPKHAQAIYDQCRAIGVPALASLPALGIQPPKDGPTNLETFFFKYLGISPERQRRAAGQ